MVVSAYIKKKKVRGSFQKRKRLERENGFFDCTVDDFTHHGIVGNTLVNAIILFTYWTAMYRVNTVG